MQANQKVKFKFIGNLGKCHLKYDKISGNYTYTDEDYPQNNIIHFCEDRNLTYLDLIDV